MAAIQDFTGNILDLIMHFCFKLLEMYFVFHDFMLKFVHENKNVVCYILVLEYTLSYFAYSARDEMRLFCMLEA